jgi:hypothetical protein
VRKGTEIRETGIKFRESKRELRTNGSIIYRSGERIRGKDVAWRIVVPLSSIRGILVFVYRSRSRHVGPSA